MLPPRDMEEPAPPPLPPRLHHASSSFSYGHHHGWNYFAGQKDDGTPSLTWENVNQQNFHDQRLKGITNSTIMMRRNSALLQNADGNSVGAAGKSAGPKTLPNPQSTSSNRRTR